MQITISFYKHLYTYSFIPNRFEEATLKLYLFCFSVFFVYSVYIRLRTKDNRKLCMIFIIGLNKSTTTFQIYTYSLDFVFDSVITTDLKLICIHHDIDFNFFNVKDRSTSFKNLLYPFIPPPLKCKVTVVSHT